MQNILIYVLNGEDVKFVAVAMTNVANVWKTNIFFLSCLSGVCSNAKWNQVSLRLSLVT